MSFSGRKTFSMMHFWKSVKVSSQSPGIFSSSGKAQVAHFFHGAAFYFMSAMMPSKAVIWQQAE